MTKVFILKDWWEVGVTVPKMFTKNEQKSARFGPSEPISFCNFSHKQFIMSKYNMLRFLQKIDMDGVLCKFIRLYVLETLGERNHCHVIINMLNLINVSRNWQDKYNLKTNTDTPKNNSKKSNKCITSNIGIPSGGVQVSDPIHTQTQTGPNPCIGLFRL